MDVPPNLMYANVLSHETVFKAQTMAAFNAFKVMVADIMNTYFCPKEGENLDTTWSQGW